MVKVKDVDDITDKEIEEIYNECINFANKIKNDDLRNCCLEIYKDYKKELISKPATAGNCHHFYKGGLLYHTYSVTRNAITIADMYSHVKLDKDLIIFGALLHDIGKTQDFKDYDLIKDNDDSLLSKSGNMLGHSYEGTRIVESYLNRYSLEHEFKVQALHMIACHMRDFGEYGTLTSPKMLEVLVINYGDAMDAELDNNRIGINNASKGEEYKDITNSTLFFKSLNNY